MEKLSRGEIIELINRLTNPQPGDTDSDRDRLMQQIADSVPDPHVSDYIFWDRTGMTAEQIVDKALAYKPIAL